MYFSIHIKVMFDLGAGFGSGEKRGERKIVMDLALLNLINLTHL